MVALMLRRCVAAALVLASTASLRLGSGRRSLASPRSAAAAVEDDAQRPKRSLDREFAAIALPAVIQFAAEPVARLVDTAYMGRLGSVALGGAGAAVAGTYALSKCSNDPLLRTSISLVAAEGGGGSSASVAAALSLALFVGAAQAILTLSFAPWLLDALCGVGAGSPMRAPALAYLRTAALGAPTATVWLATNGIFRGLGDTSTPLRWALAFTAMNAVLDPIFIFPCGLGAAGAALGTALAQTLALLPLLRALARRLGKDRARDLFDCDRDDLVASLRAFLKAGSLVLFRTLGKISAYSICAREAAKLGPVASAAHTVCFALGVATTQLCEASAVAAQALIAREFFAGGGRASAARSRRVVALGLGSGLVMSSTLAAATFASRRAVVAGLTTDPAVRAACLSIFPLVMLCQVLKGLAYPVNGCLMGALDWSAASATMWASNAACFLSLLRPGPTTITKLWQALAAIFVTQCAAGIARVASGSGPWANLRE